MNDIVKEVQTFYNECVTFSSELDILSSIDELMVINIKKILDIGDIAKFTSYNNIIEFLNFIKHINLTRFILGSFVEHISIDIYKYKDITDTNKFNFNLKQTDLRKLYKSHVKQIKQKLSVISDEYYNTIETIDDDTLTQINDLYNDSFILLNKDIFIQPQYTIFNISSLSSVVNEKININNLIINEIGIIYNKFIDANAIILQFNEINKSNILVSTGDSHVKTDKYKCVPNGTEIFKLPKVNFQLFTFIPFLLKDKGKIININDLIYKLIQYKITNSDNSQEGILTGLLNAAKFYSISKHVNLTFIVIQNTGNLINYNINPLFDNNTIISNTAGVNNDMVYKFNTIEQLVNKQAQEEFIHVINYSNDKPNIGVLLETVDFINFRIMLNVNVINNINKSIEDGIHNKIFVNDQIITKILNQQPSSRIANYNKVVEDSILSKMQDNSISQFYTSVDTNFNIYTSTTVYDEFTNHIIDAIINNIESIIKDKTSKKHILPILLDKSNIDIFISSIIEFYNSMKLTTNESFITYLSLMEYTINKFKKELIDNYNSITYDKQESMLDILYNLVSISVKNVINVKTHMYDMSIEKEQLLIAFKHKLSS